MKKIFIASHCMEIGGAERSLLGLLNSINFKEYQVDLFLYRHSGEFLDLIPKKVNLLPENKKYATLARSMFTVLKEGHLDIVAARLLGKILAHFYDKINKFKMQSEVSIEYSHKYTRKLFPRINSDTEYDLAISFLTPHYIVKEKIKAKSKVAWIHTDYTTIQTNAKSELKMWHAYDTIVAVSDSVKFSFIKVFPSLREKVLTIENILSPDFVLQQAELEDVSNEISKDKGIVTICSVGRFTEAKNFDNVPHICKELIDNGCNVRWYLIGYGGDEELIKKKIKETGMRNNVIILGKKINPYPYIKACDIYIQPSRYEGKAVTVREAQILSKPVIITNFATSRSQLKDGFDGVIVPMDTLHCAKGIQSVIENRELLKKLTHNCKNSQYNNVNEIQKIYNLIK